MNWIWSKTSRRIAWVLAVMFLWSGAGQQAAQAAVQSCKELRDLAVPQSRILSDREMDGILGGCKITPDKPCKTCPKLCGNRPSGGPVPFELEPGTGGNDDGGCATCGSGTGNLQVNDQNGNMSFAAKTTAQTNGCGPINVRAYYNSQETNGGVLGQAWSHNLNVSLTENPSDNTSAQVRIVTPNGVRNYWTADTPLWQTTSNATFTGAAGVGSTLVKVNGQYQLTASDSLKMNSSGSTLHTFGPVSSGTAYLGTIQAVGIPTSVFICSLVYSGGHISAAVDAVGNRTTFNYIGGTSRVSYIQAPGDVRTTFQYTVNTDGLYDLSAIITPTDSGQPPSTFTYTYDVAHKMRTAKTSLGNTTTFTYSDATSTGRLTAICDALGYKTSYAYTPSAGPVDTFSVTYPWGATTVSHNDIVNWVRLYDLDAAGDYTTYTYNADKHLQTEAYQIDGQLCSVTYSYDTSGHRTKELYSPANTSVTYSYAGNGDLRSKTNENGQATTFTYDNHRVATMMDPLGNISTYVYDWNSANSGPIQIAGTGECGISTLTYTYVSVGAAAGQLSTIKDALGNTTTQCYDYNGHLCCRQVSPTNGVVYTTTVGYDLMGRRKSVTNPDGVQTLYCYDCCHLKNVTDGNGNTTSRDYWADGAIMKITDAQGAVTITSYGYVPGAKTSWQTMTNAMGKTTTYTYDSRDLLMRIQHPDNTSENYTYEQSKRVKTMIDARGKCTTCSYNSRGWLVKVDYPNDTDVIMSYDNVGRVIGVTDASGSTSRTYDAAGRLYTKRTIITGLTDKLTTYSYYADGCIQNVQCNGYTNTYHYDQAGRINWLNNSDDQKVTYTYDRLGRKVKRSLDNGAYTSYGYNNRGWITDVQNIKRDGTSVLSSFSYYYMNGDTTDNMGNILKTVQTLSDGNAYTSTYCYDNDYRLTYEGMVGPTSYGYSYTYDAVGNRNTLAVDGAGITTYIYDLSSNNELDMESSGVTTNTNVYDSRGNTLTKTISGGGGISTYTYNDMNMVTKIEYPGGTSNVYVYDGNGNRVKKIGINGIPEYYLYDDSRLLVVLDANGNNKHRYDWGPDGIVYVKTEGIGTHYLGCDRMGSTLNMVSLDNTENIVATYTYTAFGCISAYDAIGNPFRYAGSKGYYSDLDSGLISLGRRLYDPNTGRFSTLDPIKSGLNWYAYASNNPITMYDPTGLFCIWVGTANWVLVERWTDYQVPFWIWPWSPPGPLPGFLYHDITYSVWNYDDVYSCYSWAIIPDACGGYSIGVHSWSETRSNSQTWTQYSAPYNLP